MMKRQHKGKENTEHYKKETLLQSFRTGCGRRLLALTLTFLLMAGLAACGSPGQAGGAQTNRQETQAQAGRLFGAPAAAPAAGEQDASSLASDSDIPAYSGEAYAVINGNTPFFTEEELQTESYESYSDLDDLGRCGPAQACIGQDLMPTEERGSIGSVKPTGWHTVKYDNVDGKYLYNRCHLIGYQLTAENANEKNLITGTRYMNVEGMLPFENMTADYIKETDNHVLYRVTPVFDGDNLVADGVLMEALSVEDNGDGVCFNVFVYNVQPGISIDYATGESSLAKEVGEAAGANSEQEQTYILNTGSKKFHLPSCSSVDTISEENRSQYTGSRDSLIADGYSPCGRCKP